MMTTLDRHTGPGHFLVYWKNLRGNFVPGAPIDHAWSRQFKRVTPGDTLWIVTVIGGVPYLLGRLRVAGITRSGGVLHASASGRRDVVRKIPAQGILHRLRFGPGKSRLRPAVGAKLAQQLQSIRKLTPASASLLADLNSKFVERPVATEVLDRTDPKDAAAVLETLIPDREDRQAFIEVLANSIEAAHAVGPESWSVSLFGSLLRLNVGPIEALTVGREFVRLLTLDASMRSSNRRRLLGSVFLGPQYKSVPGRKRIVIVEPDELRATYRWARPAHEALCERAAGLRSRSSFRNSYSEGVLLMLEATLRRKLPRPGYFSPTTHVLVASNRDEQNIESGAGHAQTLRGWVVPKVARPGDAALFFSRKSGLIADGVIGTNPRPGKRFGLKATLRASVANVRSWTTPIGLAELRTIKGWRWLNYPMSFTTVPAEVGPVLWDLIRRHKGGGAPGSLEAKAETALRASGTGFGTPEENRKVEKAAVAFVRRHLEKEGHEAR